MGHDPQRVNPPSADLRYREEGNISPSTLICAAIKGLLGIYTLICTEEVSPERKLGHVLSTWSK